MFSYLIRRLLYAIPIIFGVMVITFALFYLAQSPETMAKRVLGPKAPPAAVQNWLHQRGYDKPVFLNLNKGENLWDSQFCRHIVSLATFDLGVSDVTGQPVIERFKQGAIPSLLVTVPAFFTGLACAIALSLFLVYVRNTKLDFAGIVFSVILMSIPAMVYVIFGQWLFAVVLKYFPAFGFSTQGVGMVRFLFLPVFLLALIGVGGDVRLFRSIFLEEVQNDYVRTANAKGLGAGQVMLRHVLKNGMLNIITLTVAALPSLILGSLILEQFFGIPGLGDMSIQAIRSLDFAVIRAVTYVGAILYLIGLILTDICYSLVDPRVKLE